MSVSGLQEGQDLSCTYLAHHELDSVLIVIIVVVVIIIIMSSGQQVCRCKQAALALIPLENVHYIV